MNIIKCNDYCFKIKWGKKYIWPSEHYIECYYDQKQISSMIKEIENEYPRYKGKVKVFRRCLMEI